MASRDRAISRSRHRRGSDRAIARSRDGEISRLHVSVVDGRGRPVRVPGLADWLARTAPRSVRGEVSIALVSDARIRALNRTYRKKDRATDVLSFGGVQSQGFGVHVPASQVGPTSGVGPADPEPYLGDIAIARRVAVRQAREAGHSLAVELRILALHGLLHLLGYDHERDRGEMRLVEQRLRRKGGLRDSLIERASRPHRHR